jgi:predicted deacetylase
MSDQMKLILYTGPLCHLCQQAKDLVYPLLAPGAVLTEFDIHQDETARQKYATSIPVLAAVDSEDNLLWEKAWPFSAGQIKRLLRNPLD